MNEYPYYNDDYILPIKQKDPQKSYWVITLSVGIPLCIIISMIISTSCFGFVSGAFVAISSIVGGYAIISLNAKHDALLPGVYSFAHYTISIGNGLAVMIAAYAACVLLIVGIYLACVMIIALVVIVEAMKLRARRWIWPL